MKDMIRFMIKIYCMMDEIFMVDDKFYDKIYCKKDLWLMISFMIRFMIKIIV
jgi:hypothetical protein